MAGAPPVAPASRPIWARVLVGCALVGGLFILAGIGSCIFGMYWLTSAGRQVATGAVAGPKSQGVIRVGDLAADPGARALLSAFFLRMQQAGASHQPIQLPAWIRNMQAQQARQSVSQWLPREATVSLEPDHLGGTHVVVAANLRGFVRPIRLAVTQSMKGDPKARITRHGDHEILNLGGGGAICFMGGTLVVGNQAAALPAVLDRLSTSGAPPRRSGERALPGDWDVNGWLEGDPAAKLLTYLLEPPDDASWDGEIAPPVEGVRDVRFGIDLESADAARLTVEIAFASADAAAAAEPRLAEGMARLRTKTESSGLTATVTASLEGERLRYQLALTGIDTAFDQMVEAYERGQRQRADP